MLNFPNAKINLGIRVLNKRPDGYHQIETVFYPVPLSDILEIIPVRKDFKTGRGSSGISYHSVTTEKGRAEVIFAFSGLDPGGTPEDNLVVKAVRLFDSFFSLTGRYYVHLHKVIPTGAGLGGGSSDASFVLKTLNDLLGRPFDSQQLHDFALRLGSDCPFFITNSPVLATGRGELMRRVDIELKGWYLMIVKPEVHVSTVEAFGSIQPGIPETSLAQLILLPVDQWQHHLVNDFEKVIFEKYPAVESVKSQLLNAGAVYCGMSGSGSAVVALFREKTSLPVFPSGYYVYRCLLS